MSLSRQQKTTAALLILYLPSFFIAAHTPIPQVVREADVSDKGLHFLAYLILGFLLWFTVSDGRKVNWRKTAPWIVLFAVLIYGILDEWLQSFVAGRSCDPRDFLADTMGICLGLCAFSFLSFWPAGFLVTAVIISVGDNIARADLPNLLPAANAAFHLITYGILTAFWLHCVRGFIPAVDPRRNRTKWLLISLAAPTGLLLATKLSSAITGRQLAAADIVSSIGATLAVVAAFYLSTVYGNTPQESGQGDRLT